MTAAWLASSGVGRSHSNASLPVEQPRDSQLASHHQQQAPSASKSPPSLSPFHQVLLKDHQKRMVRTQQGFEHGHPKGCLPRPKGTFRGRCLLYSMLYSIPPGNNNNRLVYSMVWIRLLGPPYNLLYIMVYSQKAAVQHAIYQCYIGFWPVLGSCYIAWYISVFRLYIMLYSFLGAIYQCYLAVLPVLYRGFSAK